MSRAISERSNAMISILMRTRVLSAVASSAPEVRGEFALPDLAVLRQARRCEEELSIDGDTVGGAGPGWRGAAAPYNTTLRSRERRHSSSSTFRHILWLIVHDDNLLFICARRMYSKATRGWLCVHPIPFGLLKLALHRLSCLSTAILETTTRPSSMAWETGL